MPMVEKYLAVAISHIRYGVTRSSQFSLSLLGYRHSTHKFLLGALLTVAFPSVVLIRTERSFYDIIFGPFQHDRPAWF
jgi:hypothetical protein